MGNFYTTVQILDNEKLGSKKFTEKFCKKMADEGYVSCGGDEAEQSYILHFAENSSWVAIASEEYTPDGQKARADALRFAKLLKAPCVNTNVIDSDCAVMDVYGATGKKLDTLIMGRADDYFGDDYPNPSEKIWGMFLTDGTTWERFMEVRNGDYTFVEDGLAELAPLIGMDSSNIGFTSEDAIADDDTVFLYFKSAGKKPKKLTLNAAFKQVFGQALEPLGFQLVKSKYPYYVRMIGDEILHIVTFKRRRKNENNFYIWSGVATVFRKAIDFDRDIDFNTVYLMDNYKYYYNYFIYDTNNNLPIPTDLFEYDERTLMNQMTKAVIDFKKYALPIISEVTSLRKCLDYFYFNNVGVLYMYSADEEFGLKYRNVNNEALLYFKINDRSDWITEMNQKLLRIEYHFKDLDKTERLKKIKEEREELNKARENRIFKRDNIFNDSELLKRIENELISRKANNLKKLQEYDIKINN